MSNVQISVSVHPNTLELLKKDAKKYNITPQKIIKQLIFEKYGVDPVTGEIPLFAVTKRGRL